MRIISLRRYAAPKYPVRGVLDEHPELLRLVPRRWQGNATVLSALAGLCLLSSGSRASAKAASASAPRIAPVFQHGDGRGSFGCKAVNPPVLLSEDEARALIMEEAKRAGITFRPTDRIVNDIRMPSYGRHGESDKPTGTHRISVEMDGMDAKRQIAYEYVSDADYWPLENMKIYASAYGVDTRRAALSLRESMAKARPAGTCAVFYDPMTKPSLPKYNVRDASGQVDYQAERNMLNEDAKKVSREQLRAQVRDFIKWLKVQGVI